MRRVVAGLVALGACTRGPEVALLRGGEFVCDEVISHADGPGCELVSGPDVEVRVWIPGDLPEVWIDDERTEPIAAHAVAGGWRLTLQPTEGTARVTVRRDGQEWRLPLVWRSERAFDNTLGELYVAGRWRDCKSLASVEFAAARASGRWLRALTVARTGIECSNHDGDMLAVDGWLVDVDRVPDGDDVRGLRRDELMISTLAERGVLYATADTLERALARSERLGTTNSHSELLMRRSALLGDLGDPAGAVDAADAALDPVVHPFMEPCDRVTQRVDLAWTLLRAASRTREAAQLDEAEGILHTALVLAQQHECPPDVAYMNLAWVGLLAGAPQTAARWLDVAEPLAVKAGGKVLAELQLVRARTLIATGDLVDARVAISRVGIDLDAELIADLAMTRVELAEAEGNLLLAEELLTGEHRRNLQRIGVIGHEQGVSRNVYDRLIATQALVQLLVDRGDTTAALAVAREAAAPEARLLAARHIHSRADADAERTAYLGWRDACEQRLIENWERSGPAREALCAEARREAALLERRVVGDGVTVDMDGLSLRAPAAGEVVLLYFPLTRERVLGFAATADVVLTAEIPAAEIPVAERGVLAETALAAASEVMLGPFASAIDGAQHVRVLPSFGRQSLPFHALPWRGQPLLMHADVETSLDLPTRRESNEVRAGVLVLGVPW